MRSPIWMAMYLALAGCGAPAAPSEAPSLPAVSTSPVCGQAPPRSKCVQVGSIAVAATCDGGECAVTVAGREVVKLWHHGEAAAMLRYLGAPPSSQPVHVFLLSEHQGDGCPVMYRVLAVDPNGAATLTEPFGNCEEPDWSSTHGAGDALAWHFAANADPALASPRPALDVRYSLSRRRLTETAVRPP